MFHRPLLVVGGIALDITATVVHSKASILHTSTPGRVKQTLGGVGRNVAEAALRTGGTRVKLVSVVGDDLAGKSILEGMKQIGMDTEHIEIMKGQSTAVYNALHSSDGQLVAAVADMDILEKMNASRIVSVIQSEQPNFLCFDGNVSSDVMKEIAQTCHSLSIPAFFEPTSVPKSLKLFKHFETTQSKSIKYISPNQFELEALCERIHSDPLLYKQIKPINPSSLNNAPRLAQNVLPQALCLSNYVPNVITKLGQDGCLFVNQSVVKYFPPEIILPHEIKSVTGAGDW
ncbi:hypothetical protein G6F37_008457 [Rhizopus arrhizus]|nr:hypothetical protein G6F38_002766 [Rhizopus arrhizus]KAG1155532.1 hypothetical protein G6F37_008457 [Rhizopus arrhizus]